MLAASPTAYTRVSPSTVSAFVTSTRPPRPVFNPAADTTGAADSPPPQATVRVGRADPRARRNDRPVVQPHPVRVDGLHASTQPDLRSLPGQPFVGIAVRLLGER